MMRRALLAAAYWGMLTAGAGSLAGCAAAGGDGVPALGGTHWEVTGLHDGGPAQPGVLAGARPTLVFDDAGRVGGSSGCNRYSAAVELADGGLRIGHPATTRMSCAEPGVMAQEQVFLSALVAVRAARIDADHLELRGADGVLRIRARALSKAP